MPRRSSAATDTRAKSPSRAHGARGQRTRVVVTVDAADRDVVRSIARVLAANGPDADRLREIAGTPAAALVYDPKKPGGLLEALRAAPPAFADIDLTRPFEPGRDIEW